MVRARPEARVLNNAFGALLKKNATVCLLKNADSYSHGRRSFRDIFRHVYFTKLPIKIQFPLFPRLPSVFLFFSLAFFSRHYIARCTRSIFDPCNDFSESRGGNYVVRATFTRCFIRKTAVVRTERNGRTQGRILYLDVRGLTLSCSGIFLFVCTPLIRDIN